MTIMFRNGMYKGSIWNDESDRFNGWARMVCYSIFTADNKNMKNEPTEKNYTPDTICGTWIR